MSRWKFARPATHRLFGRDDLAASIRRAGFRDDEFSIREVERRARRQGSRRDGEQAPRSQMNERRQPAATPDREEALRGRGRAPS